MTRRIYLASGNAHKAREFRALARQYPVAAPAAPGGGTMLEIALPDELPAVVEDAGSFIGNARKKALALRQALPPGAWVLADDSGLLVDALDGAPGVESAYFAGPQGDFAANLAKLVATMRGIPAERRRAHFYCVLALLPPSGPEAVFEGRCDGRLAGEPAGGAGFGYDPLFIPDGHDCTYAELGEPEKNRISHRARAWGQLVGWAGWHQA